MDVIKTAKATGKDIKEGVTEPKTLAMIVGATLGLVVGVMVMHLLFADKPSLTPYIPIVGAKMPVPPAGGA